MSGIYLHIPFCRQRCTYCDFHFSTRFDNYREALIVALNREIELRKNEIQGTFSTIYFGGGTPSLLTEKELNTIFNSLYQHYSFEENPEITFEANPEDLSEGNLKLWKSLGINRLSIGVQSFRANDLEWMNRGHRANEAAEGVKRAQAIGFENISVDLIYGLPNLSIDNWKQHLEEVFSWDVPHLSAYCLTVEKRTALNYQVNKKRLLLPDENAQSEQFKILIESAEEHGLEQYEISNFSKTDWHSRHNSSYWKGAPYLGFGPSAHSFSGEVRRWNHANNTVYYKNVGKNETWFDSEKLTQNERWNELFLLGLRTKWGIQLEVIQQFGGLTPNEQLLLHQFINEGKMIQKDEQIVLSKAASFLADGIAAEFFRV